MSVNKISELRIWDVSGKLYQRYEESGNIKGIYSVDYSAKEKIAFGDGELIIKILIFDDN